MSQKGLQSLTDVLQHPVTSILQVDNLWDPVLRALRARADRQHHQPRHPLQQVGG